MTRACIAVVDATRARLFTFERSVAADGTHDGFYERIDLVNPARHRRASELFSDTRPGTNRNARFQYAFDDHRDAHIDRLDAVFAGEIAAAIDRLVRETHARHLIVCASPRMLGALRRAELGRDGLIVEELARDLTKLSISQLRDQLAEHHLLPARRPRPGLVRHA